MAQSTRDVLARPSGAALAAATFGATLVVMLYASDYVFFEPYLTAHVPEGGAPGLAAIAAMSALSAVALPLGIRAASAARAARRGGAAGAAGAAVGAIAGACGCGPVTIALVGSLGAAGASAASFLAAYDLPLRLVAIAALCASIYASSAALAPSCRA
ncbi:MAG: hypothetical protein OXU85_06030 [Thaumarchaeota archaeon]|nr:hypothetical protein [Nitrososphaerota archaeon]